jgi:16S rRNA (guanine527-N7)-methyltransferase
VDLLNVTDPARAVASGRLGVVLPPLPDAMVATLELYFDELTRWSSRLNLTSIHREQMWARNVVEVIDLLEVAAPPAGSRVVDIGSGGGVPGVVIAILRPDVHVTLIEADLRKSGFLTHVAGFLGLARVDVEAIRAEDAGRFPGIREDFDLATSRAAAPPPVLCELALPLLRLGGVLCAMVSDAAEAVESCAAAALACGGGAPAAPTNGVLCVRKLAPTPDRYPRRAGMPNRHPIS